MLGSKWQSFLYFFLGGRLDSFLDSSVAGSSSGCLLLSQLEMLLRTKEMLHVVDFNNLANDVINNYVN